jgi:hypothetical protein
MIFLICFLIVFTSIFTFLFILAPMPGRIAKKHNHPHANVIRLSGWAAIFSGSISAWILALMWAHNSSEDAVTNFESRIALHNKKAKSGKFFKF